MLKKENENKVKNNSKVWLCHFLSRDLNFSKIGEDDILTFDDGHYSILENIDAIENLPNRKILFIVPNFIELRGRRKEKPNYDTYWMDDFFLNHSRDQFLNLSEIELLMNKYNFEIGAHSYYHDIVYLPRSLNNKFKFYPNPKRKWYYHKLNDPNLFKLFTYCSALSEPGIDGSHRRTEEEFKEYIEEDTYSCSEWIKKYIGFTNKYAYPFFERSDYLDCVLSRYGYDLVFGEREEIYFFN